MNSSTENRLEFIDSLRGIAATYVVLFHLVRIPNPKLTAPPWASTFINWGGSGVTLFFVISAFTLTYMSRIHANEPHVIKRFYVRRFFRIAPLYYIWLVVFLLYAFFIFDKSYTSLNVLSNIFFAFNLIPGWHNGIVAASWTIGVEVLFYLIFPILYKYANNLWKTAALFFFSLMLSSFFDWIITFYRLVNIDLAVSFIKQNIITKFPIFINGMFLYYLYEFMQKKPLHSSVGFFFVAFGLWSYGALITNGMKIFYKMIPAVYLQSVIYSILVYGLSIYPWKIIVNRVTRFLGEISYSMYLGHPLIISFVASPIIKSIYAISFLSNSVKYILCSIVVFTMLIILALFTYRFVEKPGIQYGKKLIRKYWSV